MDLKKTHLYLVEKVSSEEFIPEGYEESYEDRDTIPSPPPSSSFEHPSDDDFPF